MHFGVDTDVRAAYIILEDRDEPVKSMQLESTVLLDFYSDGTLAGIEIIDFPTELLVYKD